jgi:primosomal protein N' (replication factor Y)
MARLADIVVPLPIEQTFTYLIPPDLESSVTAGCRVMVSFGRKTAIGIVVGFPPSSSVKKLKPILDVLDTRPTFSEEMLKFTRWISDYYLTPWGEVLRAAMPQGLAAEQKRIVQLTVDSVDQILSTLPKRAVHQHAVLNALRNGALSVSRLRRLLRTRSISTVLAELQSKGWISLTEELPRAKVKPKMQKIVTIPAAVVARLKQMKTDDAPAALGLTHKQYTLLSFLLQKSNATSEPFAESELLKEAHASSALLITLEKKGLIERSTREAIRSAVFSDIEPPVPLELNDYQRKAFEEIRSSVDAGRYKTFLLHGVTGSGKTQVYIEVIRHALALGKTAIVLVPEISLTPQTVRRFKAHFGHDVAVMHSQMSSGERYDAWRLARDGRIKVVIGPRSAIFAPLGTIGLIVVDEEHESSYKQFDASPRYHARDVAVVRASQLGAVVILGSATPSSESYFNAITGKYRLLELPIRADNARLPSIEIVDMAKERRQRYEELKKQLQQSGKPFPKRFPQSSVSKLLEQHIARRLEKKEGVILLQNRRGFSHVLECHECGYVEKCERCEVTLTYHALKKHLRCHYCGFVKAPPTICPSCQGFDIRLYAFGTQQVEEELNQLFPHARILRMDLDTTSRKGAHDRILRQFGSGEGDILLGTQMVAKGLDFPRVTLVGVISADTQMLLPDFRASERTFQLLTQVAGRAGRSELAGEVIIQTLQPDHYSLKHVLLHDFPNFYKEELEHRRELDYPPFSRIVLVEFKGARENEVHHHARKFAEYMMEEEYRKYLIVLGPADAAIPKIRNQFRKHIVIKGLRHEDPAGIHLRTALRKAKEQYEQSALHRVRTVQMIIDVDPVGMM